MGLIELIGEAMNPGKIGTVDRTKGKKEKRIGMLIVKSILSIAIVAVLYYLIFGISFHLKEALLFVAVVTVYSAISYLISPKPDYSNMGWLCGAIDNPFKISDDINRTIFWVMILLVPGRLISTTVLSWIDLIRK